MRRHPIEDHADLGLVTGVDESGEVIRRAVTGARGELRQQLITPGATERMLHDRHQFNVGETQLLHIRNQPFGQLGPSVLTGDLTQVIQLALPGTGV